MPCIAKRKPRTMSDKNPPKPDEPGVPDSPSDSDLSGLTKAIGGLDPAVADHDPLEGAIIGEVKIKRLIAEGGMGRVYEGLQDKPRRPVAVKIMRPGFVSREACRRFDNESEVLGRLRHPYIVEIYSAGICTIVGAQVPYFVMELVPDALPITKYAAAKKLSTNDRIELFRKVCEAVAHGHEKNVIHRDLKPSNILVEPNGVPKIIDFGVARCVDASPEAITAMTDMGRLIGTVQYMSPEQFSENPTNVDVRADVYALGVILYELLANRPPYEIRQKEIFEAARVVRDYKPVSPAKFNLNLTADVVRITGTCLQKDRRRRYANAVELQGALADYLGGKPVPDRNPGWLGSVITQARDWAGNIPVRLTVGLALAGLVATLGAWLLWPALPSAVKDHAAGFYADVVESLNGVAAKPNKSARAPVFLSDMPVKRSLVGWDRLRMGRLPDLRINGDVYDQVINAHASSLVAFDLPDGFNGSLQGWVAIAGLSKEISSPGSCRFRILGGDNLLWESGVIAQDKKTGLSVIEQFDVNLKDVKAITLEVDSLGANLSDWSVWVDPVLLWQGSTLAN